MSTSYYWILDETGRRPDGKVVEPRDHDNPEWHIGKRVNAGVGRWNQFIWAQRPDAVAVIVSQHFNDVCIVSEYEEALRGRDFAMMLLGMEGVWTYIGQEFS